MKYYFEDLEKQAQLKIIIDEWLDTPFRHMAGAKHVGCDCIHFVARAFEEMGIIKWRKNLIPHYSYDWYLHNTPELLADGIERNFNVEKLSPDTPKMNGDILLYHMGKASSHASIFFDNYVYQSLTDIGVCKIHVSDKKLAKRMHFIYRILM